MSEIAYGAYDGQVSK